MPLSIFDIHTNTHSPLNTLKHTHKHSLAHSLISSSVPVRSSLQPPGRYWLAFGPAAQSPWLPPPPSQALSPSQELLTCQRTWRHASRSESTWGMAVCVCEQVSNPSAFSTARSWPSPPPSQARSPSQESLPCQRRWRHASRNESTSGMAVSVCEQGAFPTQCPVSMKTVVPPDSWHASLPTSQIPDRHLQASDMSSPKHARSSPRCPLSIKTVVPPPSPQPSSQALGLLSCQRDVLQAAVSVCEQQSKPRFSHR